MVLVPVLRYKSLCKLYIVVCFVQHSILHNNMCVYVYIFIYIIGFTPAKISCDFCHSSVFCEALREIIVINLPQTM